MMPYELSNTQRKFFGLTEVAGSWDRKLLSKSLTVYFNKNKIVKILNYSYAYLEYDTDIDTINREILLPKTTRGKEQKLTVARVSKIKGSGMQFSGSFEGGGISVYNNKRNIFLTRSYSEDGQISNYTDIENWVNKYIIESPSDYFEWLNEQLNRKRENNKITAGDIIAFPVGRFEYGFARIIKTDFLSEHILLDGEIFKSNIFGKPLIIIPYSIISKTWDINFDQLIKQPTLGPIQINDSCIFYGEFPIVSFKELHNSDIPKIELSKISRYLTIPYSKTDILQRKNKW